MHYLMRRYVTIKVKGDFLKMNQIPSKITIHCSDTENLKHVSLKALEEDHIKRGFGGIGYHMLIQPGGEVYNTRPLNEIGAHVGGYNSGNIGICLAGKNKFTLNQFDSMRNQCESLMRIYQIPLWEIYVHNQWESAIKQGKTCPNFNSNKLIYFLCTSNYKALKEYIGVIS